jgi:hypothetical protein
MPSQPFADASAIKWQGLELAGLNELHRFAAVEMNISVL